MLADLKASIQQWVIRNSSSLQGAAAAARGAALVMGLDRLLQPGEGINASQGLQSSFLDQQISIMGGNESMRGEDSMRDNVSMGNDGSLEDYNDRLSNGMSGEILDDTTSLPPFSLLVYNGDLSYAKYVL